MRIPRYCADWRSPCFMTMTRPFLGFYERVAEKLRTALATRHMPVILQGEPVLGLEAGAASLIARDDVVLNLVSGVYGAGFGYWAKRYCAELLEIRVPFDQVINPASVAAMLKAGRRFASLPSVTTTRRPEPSIRWRRSPDRCGARSSSVG